MSQPKPTTKMKTRILLLVLTFLVFSKQDLYSQLGFSHEIGVIAGPLAFYSDFGQRNDNETNFGNSSIAIGIIHYMNFSYRADCNCYTSDKYFNDHFKVRSEIDYHKTKLNHSGRWVAADQQGSSPDFLRSMEGETRIFELGAQLEYFPLSIRDFSSGGYKLAPFISAGLHWISYDPSVTYDQQLGIDSNFYGGKYDPVTTMQQEAGNTWAFLASVGVRYKLTPSSDLMLDSRIQYYFSNWVDGLNPDVTENKSNEWHYWLNFGYIYYIQ